VLDALFQEDFNKKFLFIANRSIVETLDNMLV